MPMPKSFSDQLREAIRLAMKHRGVSEGRLATEAGLDPAMVWRFVRGRTRMQAGNIDKLVASLGLRLTTQGPISLVPRPSSRTQPSKKRSAKKAVKS